MLENQIIVDRTDLERLARAYEQGDDAGILWELAKYVSVKPTYVNIYFRLAAWLFAVLWLFTVGAWAFLLLLVR